MDIAPIIGLTAGLMTTTAFLPQAIKAWKTKSTKDLSFKTFLIFWVGVTFWITYGIMINDLPLIIANMMTFFLASFILIIKMRYG